ncbi:hypothetical protein D3C79_1111070 [compost metagenome]
MKWRQPLVGLQQGKDDLRYPDGKALPELVVLQTAAGCFESVDIQLPSGCVLRFPFP